MGYLNILWNSWKNEALLNEKVYKLIKVYLRRLSKNPKKPLLTKDATTQRWTTMKEISGQAKQNNKSSFLAKLKTDSKIKTGEDKIANEFYKYFANIGSSLVKNIPYPSLLFKRFLERTNTTLPSQYLSIKELGHAFFVWKQTRALALIKNFNVTKHSFWKLCVPLNLRVRNLSMVGLLDFNLSDDKKCWPVFLDGQQF